MSSVSNHPYVIASGVLDRTLEAWLLSKPNIKYNSEEEANEEINKLITSNLPISGFKMYYFKVRANLYVRDLIFTFRPLMPWSQSYRNLPIEDERVQISSEFSHCDFYEDHVKALEVIKEKSRNGEALDVIKRDLPLTTLMEFSFFMDRRTLLTMIKTLEDLDPVLFSQYGIKFLAAVGIGEPEYYATKTFSIYEKLCITPGLLLKDTEKVKVLPILDSDVYFSVNFEFAIAAQFLRQHFSKVRYLEFNVVKEMGYENAVNRTCTAKTQVAVLGDLPSFKRTVSRRTCWFANFDRNDVDSWAAITDDYVKSLSDEEFDDLLPCKGCSKSCDIYEEFKLRAIKLGDPNLQEGLTAADKNEICPFLLQSLAPEKTAEMVLNSRREAQKSNSQTYRRWRRRFLSEEESN